ncbi:MAG TPA: hypothetical protein VGO56_12575 [Pyrinomonadaceae bacterium]|nr:hypothetical protein [Pyrinomonadaceae bacterium]
MKSSRTIGALLLASSFATDRSWAEPVGMTLEIVPESDPTQLHAR